MAITLGYSGSTGTSSSPVGTYTTGAITGSSVQNDLMVVAIFSQVTTTGALTDNFGNTYTQVGTNYNFTGSYYLSLWYCYQSIHWGTNPTFGMSSNTSGWQIELNVYNFTGLSATPLETSAQSTGSMATSISGASVNNNNVPDLIFSVMGANISATLSGGNWNNLVVNTSASTSMPLATQQLIKAAGSGANVPTLTTTQSSGFNYGSITAVFTGSGAVSALPAAHNLMMMGIGN